MNLSFSSAGTLVPRFFNSPKSIFRQREVRAREIPVGGIPVSSAAHDWKRLLETSTVAKRVVAQEFPHWRKNGTIEELIALLTTPRNCAVKYRRRWNISLSTATRNFPRSCGFEAFIARASFSLSLSLSGYLVYFNFDVWEKLDRESYILPFHFRDQ